MIFTAVADDMIIAQMMVEVTDLVGRSMRSPCVFKKEREKKDLKSIMTVVSGRETKEPQETRQVYSRRIRRKMDRSL